MRFVRFLFLPLYRLIRAHQRTDTTEPSPVYLLKATIRASFRSIQMRDIDSPAVRRFSRLIDPVWADHRAKIAPLAPGLVNLEFHRRVPVQVGYAR